MKIRSLLLIASATAGGAIASGCFQGPSDVPGTNRNEDPPIVETSVPEIVASGGVASLEVEIPFTVYDSDSTAGTLWDKCPYPGASPILRVGFSVNGGDSFSAIDPADLQIDGAAVTVPSCGDVESFDESIRIAVSTSGETHSITWSSLPYVPASADVVFRVAVSDRHYTSEPGDSDEFTVANLPTFSVSPVGARPGQTLVGAELSGVLTSWDGTTTVGSADNLTVNNLTVTADDAATADITMGPDTDQILREFSLVTPGAGIPSGDEDAKGSLWTCNELGSPVVEFETQQIGNGSQFICDQGTFDLEGSFFGDPDQDLYQLVAASSGAYSISFDWSGGVDYDLIVLNTAGGLVGAAGPFGCGDCCSEAKPEVCQAPLVAGQTYYILVDLYVGPADVYDVTVSAP